MHEWCKSNLSHREQFVIVSGHVLISLTLAFAAPQGSILGPLLFLLDYRYFILFIDGQRD